jgi:alpha-beta hydrolase superfamily lysophospholipase
MIRAAAMLCTVLVTVLTACDKPNGDVASSDDWEPGAIIAATDLASADPWLESATSLSKRITYASLSGIDDSGKHVTGSVFVPKGRPPQRGWPIVVFGHTTTGSLPECAPSLSPTLLGASATVEGLVRAGYVVAVPDYQGLGNAGTDTTYHPYLDSTTAGYNMIDAVRATRKLVPDASADWVALGTSQGGQAAWAANELAGNKGWGLRFLGSASVSPTADLNGLADAAAAGELTQQQQLALQAFLAALKNEYGNDVNLDDYRRGIVQQKWDVLSSCQGQTSEQRAEVAAQITPDDLRPSNPTAVATLRGYLEKTTLPQGPAAAPMLVIYGGKDSLIPPSWTDRALDRACRMGDVIQIQMQPDKGDGQIDPLTALDWIGERFTGAPAPNDCASFTARYESSEASAGPK